MAPTATKTDIPMDESDLLGDHVADSGPIDQKMSIELLGNDQQDPRDIIPPVTQATGQMEATTSTVTNVLENFSFKPRPEEENIRQEVEKLDYSTDPEDETLDPKYKLGEVVCKYCHLVGRKHNTRECREELETNAGRRQRRDILRDISSYNRDKNDIDRLLTTNDKGLIFQLLWRNREEVFADYPMPLIQPNVDPKEKVCGPDLEYMIKETLPVEKEYYAHMEVPILADGERLDLVYKCFRHFSDRDLQRYGKWVVQIRDVGNPQPEEYHHPSDDEMDSDPYDAVMAEICPESFQPLLEKSFLEDRDMSYEDELPVTISSNPETGETKTLVTSLPPVTNQIELAAKVKELKDMGAYDRAILVPRKLLRFLHGEAYTTLPHSEDINRDRTKSPMQWVYLADPEKFKFPGHRYLNLNKFTKFKDEVRMLEPMAELMCDMRDALTTVTEQNVQLEVALKETNRKCRKLVKAVRRLNIGDQVGELPNFSFGLGNSYHDMVSSSEDEHWNEEGPAAVYGESSKRDHGPEASRDSNNAPLFVQKRRKVEDHQGGNIQRDRATSRLSHRDKPVLATFNSRDNFSNRPSTSGVSTRDNSSDRRTYHVESNQHGFRKPRTPTRKSRRGRRHRSEGGGLLSSRDNSLASHRSDASRTRDRPREPLIPTPAVQVADVALDVKAIALEDRDNNIVPAEAVENVAENRDNDIVPAADGGNNRDIRNQPRDDIRGEALVMIVSPDVRFGERHIPTAPSSYVLHDLYRVPENRDKIRRWKMNHPEDYNTREDCYLSTRAASGVELTPGVRECPIYRAFVQDKGYNRNKRWLSLGNHPEVAGDYVVWIELSQGDPIAHTQVKVKRDIWGKDIIPPTWPSISPTISSYPGPFYYRRVATQMRDKSIIKCYICEVSNHHSKECPLSIWERRSLLQKMQKCFNCLKYFGKGNPIDHICTNFSKCSKCGLYGHNEAICASDANLKYLMRPHMFFNLEQQFDHDSYVMTRDLELHDSQRLARMYSPARHQEFVTRCGAYNRDQERAYTSLETVVSSYDLLAAATLDPQVRDPIHVHIQDPDRKRYLRELMRMQIPQWDRMPLRVPTLEEYPR